MNSLDQEKEEGLKDGVRGRDVESLKEAKKRDNLP